MKIASIILILLFSIPSDSWISSDSWLSDLEAAKKEAQGSGKLILVKFSGSDWCLPCMKLKKNVFEMQEFRDYASANLVLVNIDFPRFKDNQHGKEQMKKNETLAEKYNPSGQFPFTLLLDADGKIMRQWDGYSNTSAKDFVSQIKLCL